MFLNFHCHISLDPSNEILNLDQTNTIPDSPFSIGLHPFHEGSNELDHKLLDLPNCLALGECGLDKLSPVEFSRQIERFEKQILLSETHGLPLILHCVKSWNEVKQIRTKLKPRQKWIFHGFRKIALAGDVLNEGLLLGIGPALLKDDKLRDLVSNLPLNQLLLETDDHPEIKIEHIYSEVAQLKNLPLQTVIAEVHASCKTVFTKWQIG